MITKTERVVAVVIMLATLVLATLAFASKSPGQVLQPYPIQPQQQVVLVAYQRPWPLANWLFGPVYVPCPVVYIKQPPH